MELINFINIYEKSTHRELTNAHFISINTGIQQGDFTVIFSSPEIAILSHWRDTWTTKIYQEQLSLVAVDEAHCDSTWCA